MKKSIHLFLLTICSYTITAQYQAGMVNKPGGGQVFNAEQYKIDRMKEASKPNTNYGIFNAPSSSEKKNEYSSSSYSPGSNYMNSKKEWRRKELTLDYRKYAKKANSKETAGLNFKFSDKESVDVSHSNEGIEVYKTNVFHNHNKEYHEYNNILYDLYYTLPLTNTPDFGFGLQFIGRNSSFHECNDYTFFSFFITAGGKLLYLKKKISEENATGLYSLLRKEVPEMFDINSYTSIPINAELKDRNLLTITQWKDKLSLGINSDVIYVDKLSKCPISLLFTPNNLFLNKGTVTFFEGQEMYTEKKH